MSEYDRNIAEFDKKNIQPFMFVVVVIFIIFLVKFTMLTFIVVNFSVMFTDFGHIHSVILVRSSE